MKKPAIHEGEHWPFSGKEIKWTERKQEHISVWENLPCNIYFLVIKFSRIGYTGLTCVLFFHMLIKYLRINVLYEWTTLHGLLLKASGSMSDFLESVTIFLGKISYLIKDSKQKLYWIANYEAAFQNLSSTSKEKSFQWKKNFSNILNDFCWI